MTPQDSSIICWYKNPAFINTKNEDLLKKLQKKFPYITNIEAELCYYVEVNGSLSKREENILEWLLKSPLQNDISKTTSFKEINGKFLVEVGPRLNFSTSKSTNSVSICQNLGLKQVTRLEVARRYLIECKTTSKLQKLEKDAISLNLYDKMTECIYTEDNKPKKSFNENLVKRENIVEVNILKEGKAALKKIDSELGLAFDEADLDYYTNLFKNVLKRNPTNVECFDLAQSNSEHSRHWFFKGKMVIDGQEYKESLIDMISKTQECTNKNNVIKFSDNSSAIEGFSTSTLKPVKAGCVSELKPIDTDCHLIFTAETHNFPTGVAPFSGATTGTGGRIRDVQCVGRGGYCIAGTAGYSVGNLYLPDYPLQWEDPNFTYPSNFAHPRDILIEASNGASDYGNKFGEPLISGFVRSYGIVHDGERREWIKPIMFSGGIGTMEADMTEKKKPKKGDQIVKIGGPVYRIGVGGGSASSVEVQGDNTAELDFNAVQRGDAEMEQKLNRVVRACLELGQNNPILSIHDQGAGGNGNVLKELVEPVGGIIYCNKFDLGDPTINALELWGAEYQESNALLCSKEDLELLKSICERERCPVNVVGEVTNTGRVVLKLSEDKNAPIPFDLDLELVLGKMPQKIFKLERKAPMLKTLELPLALSIYKSLEQVLRLPSVASKRYLTTKVDRCVTGLIAQQQCVGPLHTPLADVAVTAVSHFSYKGIASSIGEQPIKGLINPAAGARMTVAEAISNLVFAAITDLKDVKCSGNWMWAAKLPGEGAALFDACTAMCDIMSKLGIAVDGGKDSLSMAARVGKEVVKAPGTLVVSTYAPCPDVRKVVTPDLKAPSMGKTGQLLFVDLSNDQSRLGGSALAQCFKQSGGECPDVHNTEILANAFKATQKLICDGAVLAGHDVSDGGLIVCLLEMCFGGISGIEVEIRHRQDKVIPILFSEEVGWVLEVMDSDLNHCLSVFEEYLVPVYPIGISTGYGINSKITIVVNNACLETRVLPMMQMWEETSYRLELEQTTKESADAEFNSLNIRKGPKYHLTFDPDSEIFDRLSPKPIRVAILREEGSNGDREMAAAFANVGFEVWDLTMQDLLNGNISLDSFRGIAFPGGFSYADVLGSAKGWAAGILFNEKLSQIFSQFYNRSDTFSFGACNGCQLMSLINYIVPTTNISQPNIYLDHNKSSRYECRFSTVKIEKSKSIMLQGMEDSSLGVWVAHGEGRFTFRNTEIYKKLKENKCVALRYVDDDNNPTELYPMNPNGSIEGVAGVCSENGRHLAMMPHPERCFKMMQWPYIPPTMSSNQRSPWETMFKNAYLWCMNN